MATMNVSLLESLKDFVDDRVVVGGFGTSSEYGRALIRRDRDRQRLRGLLLDGAASRATEAVDETYFTAPLERARGGRVV